MSEADVVETLERLGLSNYEARVFVALQRLGTGTAREVHDLAGVPRSQVYGAAESLEERGLLEIQRSSPITYRPVALEEARERLTERFERDRRRAFERLETLREEPAPGTESREDIWSITGSAPITTRIVGLVADADESLVFGVHSADPLTDDLLDALSERAEAGVDVIALSADERARERLAAAGLAVFSPPPAQAENERAGRLLLADDDTVLVSVVGAEETGIWSSGTNFAGVLVQLIRGAIGGSLDDGEG